MVTKKNWKLDAIVGRHLEEEVCDDVGSDWAGHLPEEGALLFFLCLLFKFQHVLYNFLDVRIIAMKSIKKNWKCVCVFVCG